MKISLEKIYLAYNKNEFKTAKNVKFCIVNNEGTAVKFISSFQNIVPISKIEFANPKQLISTPFYFWCSRNQTAFTLTELKRIEKTFQVNKMLSSAHKMEK